MKAHDSARLLGVHEDDVAPGLFAALQPALGGGHSLAVQDAQARRLLRIAQEIGVSASRSTAATVLDVVRGRDGSLERISVRDERRGARWVCRARAEGWFARDVEVTSDYTLHLPLSSTWRLFLGARAQELIAIASWGDAF